MKKTWDMIRFQRITKEPNGEMQLIFALSGIRSPIDMRNFLLDLLTEREMKSLVRRLEAARLLAHGLGYEEARRNTGMSSRTLTRVYKRMLHGSHGYPVALEQLGYELDLRRPGKYIKA